MTRAVFISVPGGSRIETYPSLLAQEMNKGFERVSISVSDAILEYIAYHHRSPDRLMQLMADIYPLDPRPDPRDILDLRISAKDSTVSYTLRRGHYLMAQFMAEHKDPRFTGKHLTCSCHPGEEVEVFLSAFPTYKMEDVRNEIARLNKAKADGERLRLSPPRPRGFRRGG